MSLELNKVSAAVLVAGLIAMVSGKIAAGIYLPPTHHGEHEEAPKRGFAVEVVEEAAGTGAGGVAAGPANILPLLADADVNLGKEITKKCASCHDFTKGGPNKVGPELYGVIGRDVAHNPGFTYSDAMSKHGGKWDYDGLNHFLYNPKGAVPGTKMAFAGVKKDNERAALIAYLRTLSDSPAPLPSKAEIEAATKDAAPKDPAASAPAGGEKSAEKAPAAH